MFEHPVWRERPFHTVYRLLTCVARQRLPGLHDAVIGYDGGRSRIAVDVRTRFGYAFYRYGHHDPDIDLARRLLSPGDIFVDGGAHIGLFSLVAAAQVGKTGRVISFEPAERTRASLTRNVALSGFGWIEVRPNALADRAETREFLTYPTDAWGSSSFAPPENLPGAQRETVTAVTLDEALKAVEPNRIRLVKLDLEGAEFAALQGAQRLLANARPDLLLEMEPEHLARQGASPADIYALLAPLGYRFFRTVEDANGVLSLVETKQDVPGSETPNVLATCDVERLKRAGLI